MFFSLSSSCFCEVVVDEMGWCRYKSALRAFFAKHHAHAVSFEVGRVSAKGGHAHVQVVPVPNGISAESVAEAFTKEGARLGIEFDFEEPETGSGREREGGRGTNIFNC